MVAQLKEVHSDAAPQHARWLTRSNVIAGAILLASTLGLIGWFWHRSNYVYVDDARVSSTMVSVSSRVGGWVTEFPIDEGQHVDKGQELAKIDSRQAENQVAQLNASLATLQAQYDQQQNQLRLTRDQIESRIEAQRSSFEAAKSALSETRVSLAQAKKDWHRAESLLAQNIISQEVYEKRQSGYEKARQSFNRMQAQLAQARAALAEAQANRTQIDVLNSQLAVTEGKRQELEVRLEQAKINLNDHVVKSPVDGVIDETFINPGEFVSPGQRMLLVHDPDDIWVKANVKETEIRHIEPGSDVTVTVDAIPGREFKGTIASVGQAATNQFALLPSPNPSGNFTKITQRLEVKVAIDQVDEMLKPGMMVELQIAAK